jgi:drug/metabolite transporter (DMT)-like permease
MPEPQPPRTGPPDRAERTRAVGFLLLALLFWAFPSLAIKLLTRYMDIYTQNLIRFTAATALLWAVCLVRFRRELRAQAAGWWRILPAAAVVFLYQMLYCEGLYVPALQPGLAFLAVRSTVLWTAVLSCVFFADERRTVRDPRFLAGISLSVLGVAGLVWAGPPPESGEAAGAAGSVRLGLLLILGSAFCWSLYTVLVKGLVRRDCPVVTYTFICTLLTAAFAGLTLCRDDTWWAVPGGWTGAGVWAAAIASGALCVGAAHALYYYGIRTLGANVCATVLLANAFIAPVLSMRWFGERFTVWHVVAGAVLIAGSAFTLQTQPAGEAARAGQQKT